jgi:hypothetical protein
MTGSSLPEPDLPLISARNPPDPCSEVRHPGRPDFRVPVGRNSKGGLVLATKASHGISYVCPGCEAPLVLRKGEVRAAHFAHKASGSCSTETALHRGVKVWIANLFRKCLKIPRTRLPKLLAPCRGAQGFGTAWLGKPCPVPAWFNLSDLAFDEVAEERGTPDGLRPDVLLLKDGAPVLGIEVLVTHAVGPSKAERTLHPWIELEAMRVLRSPMTWRPLAGRYPWTSQCRHCQFRERIEAIQFSEPCDPSDCVSELAAEFFLDAHREWLLNPRVRRCPRIVWNCPWCRKTNQRKLQRHAIRGASRSTGLGPPIRPQVILHLSNHSDVILAFALIHPPRSKVAIRLEKPGPTPVVLCKPDTTHPLKLSMQATNRPGAFICRGCGGDCAGLLSPPWIPISWSEAHQPFAMIRTLPGGGTALAIADALLKNCSGGS